MGLFDRKNGGSGQFQHSNPFGVPGAIGQPLSNEEEKELRQLERERNKELITKRLAIFGKLLPHLRQQIIDEVNTLQVYREMIDADVVITEQEQHLRQQEIDHKNRLYNNNKALGVDYYSGRMCYMGFDDNPPPLSPLAKLLSEWFTTEDLVEVHGDLVADQFLLGDDNGSV